MTRLTDAEVAAIAERAKRRLSATALLSLIELQETLEGAGDPENTPLLLLLNWYREELGAASIPALLADRAAMAARLTALEAQVKIAREALERLASPEAFLVPRVATEEETARMIFADAAVVTLASMKALNGGEGERG